MSFDHDNPDTGGHPAQVNQLLTWTSMDERHDPDVAEVGLVRQPQHDQQLPRGTAVEMATGLPTVRADEAARLLPLGALSTTLGTQSASSARVSTPDRRRERPLQEFELS